LLLPVQICAFWKELSFFVHWYSHQILFGNFPLLHVFFFSFYFSINSDRAEQILTSFQTTTLLSLHNSLAVNYANAHRFSALDAVTLSKTKKKPGLERKGKVVAEIKDAIDKYSSVYVFTYDNMRNQKLKDLREQLKSSSRYGAHMSSAMLFHLSECCSGQGLILVLLWSSILPFQAIFNLT